MLLYLSLSDKWWLLVWGCISNYFSVASPVGPVTHAAFEGRRGECKTACVIFGSQAPPAFDVWSSRSSPQLQYVWVVFLTPFCCAGCNVMYCQTRTHREVSAGFEQFIVNFCRPNLPGKRRDADVLSAVRSQIFGGRSIRCLDIDGKKTQRNAPESPVSTQKCTGSPHDSSLVSG